MKAISTAFAALAFTALMSAAPDTAAKACFGSCGGSGFFVFDIFTGVTDVFIGGGGRGCYRQNYYADRGCGCRRPYRHHRRYYR